MRFCDKRLQKHLLNGGKIIYSGITHPLFLRFGSICFKNTSGELLEYSIGMNDLTAKDWKIVKPDYNWDKIIKNKILCVFGKGMNQYYIIGYLQGINSDGKFELLGGLNYDCCKPFNSTDFNVAKNVKDYEK